MSSNQWSLLITLFITLINLKGTLTARGSGGKWQSRLVGQYQSTLGYRPYLYNSCPQLDIANGFVRHSRRTARFRCLKNFTLIGDTVVHCYGNEWSGEIPVCAAPGCLKFPPPKQGIIKKSVRDLYVTISCNPGYSLDGSSNIYCDGHYWNVSYGTVASMCKKSMLNPSTWCNFENHHQCGWSFDDPDRVTIEGPNTFGYRPYGLALSDHSGTGHMLVVRSAISGQSHQDSVNRLYSPVYETKESESCFTFWYHLGGYDKLTDPPPFKVYIKPDSMQLNDVTPWIFLTTSEAYGQWTAGQVYIPKISNDWQIVLEFNVWQKVYGLDDIFLDRNVTKCATRSTSPSTGTTGISNSWTSCKDHCSADLKDSTCSCSIYCDYLETCCPDYEIYCSSNNSTKVDDVFPDFDKLFSNETTPSTAVWIPYTKTFTTPAPFAWFFTEYPTPPNLITINANQSKIYFPNDSVGLMTKVSTINITPSSTTKTTTTTTTTTPKLTTIKTTTVPLTLPSVTTKSALINSSTTLINGTSVAKIHLTTVIVAVDLKTSNSTNQTLKIQDPHQHDSNQTSTISTPSGTTTTVNFTMNATETVNVNQSTVLTTTNETIGESGSLDSIKAESSVQQTSSMKTISILIGIFLIASLVGVVVLWKRHKEYLGSSVSADSELRFLAHEVDG